MAGVWLNDLLEKENRVTCVNEVKEWIIFGIRNFLYYYSFASKMTGAECANASTTNWDIAYYHIEKLKMAFPSRSQTLNQFIQTHVLNNHRQPFRYLNETWLFVLVLVINTLNKWLHWNEYDHFEWMNSAALFSSFSSASSWAKSFDFSVKTFENRLSLSMYQRVDMHWFDSFCYSLDNNDIDMSIESLTLGLCRNNHWKINKPFDVVVAAAYRLPLSNRFYRIFST